MIYIRSKPRDMKNKLVLTGVLAAMFFCSGSVEAQRLHKHFKRVRVEAGKVESNTVSTPESTPVVSPEKPLIAPVSEVERTWNEPVVAAAAEEFVASLPTERKVEKVSSMDKIKETFSTIGDVNPIENLRTAKSFLREMKNHDNGKVSPQDVEQTHLARWITIMIILYAVGFLFLILGIIFLYTVSYPLAVVFYALMALCWVAATIILILGLVGVMA
jgi:hypothetical protein